MISQRAGIALLLMLAVLVALIGLFLPPTPQSPAYHRFADRRSFLGIPNFGDVASNLPFAVIGLWGLGFLWRSNSGRAVQPFLDARERWPYLLVFVGLILTAFGSSYYHLSPSNQRLVWDRLPMTIVFMSMVAAVIAERVSVSAGLWLLPLLMLVGMGSVFAWYMSELRGTGDLRLYAAVQVYSALVLLVAVLLPPRYTRGSDLVVVVGCYILAKLLELLDQPIFDAEHLISGHTMKHLAAAAAGYWILRSLQRRKPICRPALASAIPPRAT